MPVASPETTFLIRRATPADAARLADLARETFVEKWSPITKPEDMAVYTATEFGVDQQRAQLLDPASTYLLAEALTGEAIGYTRLLHAPVPACVPDQQAIELVRLYVRSAWQGRKVGAALLAQALQEARQQGAATIWLGVWPENHQALRFYRAWGFQQVGFIKFVLGNDVSQDMVMVRALTDPE